MRALRPVLAIFGVLAILMGLLWIGQGTGVIMWPTSSFMLADGQWVINGAILALVGAAALWFSRRR